MSTAPSMTCRATEDAASTRRRAAARAQRGVRTLRHAVVAVAAALVAAACTAAAPRAALSSSPADATRTVPSTPADAIPTALASTIRPAPPESLSGKIAYSASDGIWIMNADGSGRRRITQSGRGLDFDPAFAPDGKLIVFRTSRGHYAPDTHGIGLEGIFVVNVRTGRERQIQPRTGGLFPDWSPDGKKIAFSGLARGAGLVDTIQVMNPDGTGLVDLGAAGECATWSPDSSKIMYCSHRGDGNWAVWVMNADGSHRRQLTHPTLREPAGAHGDYPGARSPDGAEIVYSSDVKNDREIFTMDADGSSRRRLTHSRGADSRKRGCPTGGSSSPTSTATSRPRTGTSSGRTAPACDHCRSCTERPTRLIGCLATVTDAVSAVLLRAEPPGRVLVWRGES